MHRCSCSTSLATSKGARGPDGPNAVIDRRIEGSKDRVTGAPPPHRDSSQKKCPTEAGHKCGNGMPLNLSSVKDADRQPLVTTGAGGGYLPIGALPTGHLPTGGGAGGGGSLRGRSAAAAALSIAKDAASAVRIFSMM